MEMLRWRCCEMVEMVRWKGLGRMCSRRGRTAHLLTASWTGDARHTRFPELSATAEVACAA